MHKHNFQVGSLIVVFFGLFIGTSSADDTVDLKVEFTKKNQVRVLAEIEHDGNVIVMSGDEEQTEKALKLKVVANLKYFQRMTGTNQAVRYFEKAFGNIKLEKGNKKPLLAKENQLIIARLKTKAGGKIEYASIADTLDQSEFELLQTPADPLSMSALLSQDNVKIGQKWKPSEQALAKFLNVDEITKSDVELMLKKVDGNLARVYVSGKVVADIHDVTTSMSISGIALIDVKKNLLRSMKFATDEIRPAGQIEPGFEGRTRIDLAFREENSKNLSNASLSKVIRSKKIQQRLKYVSKPGAYRINYDPRWKLIAGEADSAIMRLIDNGDLLTQCDVVLLPTRPANQPLTLTKYKKEIAKVINADKNAVLLRAEEKRSPNGLAVLSAVVTGEEQGLPVAWFYYHVAAKDGRQMTFVFTLAEKFANRVKGAADQLVNEFKFLKRPPIVARKDVMPKKKAANQYRKPSTLPRR